MSLVFLESDPWLAEFDTCENLYRDIVEQLNTRATEHRTSDKYAQISASVRFRMKQYATEVQQLKLKLEQASASSLTKEEAERRLRQVELLQSRNIQLLQRFNDRTSQSEARDSLLSRGTAGAAGPARSSVFADLGTTSWGDDDDDDPLPSEPLLPITSTVSINSLRANQQRMLEDQDKGLEVLSQTISRQKNIAITIGNEVDLHNEILDDVSERMDRVNTTIQRETSHIKVITLKDNTCGYWMVIIILFIAIIVVGLVL
ncbi:syntaxin-8-like isoform X2 [Nilaparvata lugens]|uniref:syntaxin-8-like isoform X2 n=1 Tax=Nilaparvata lugens TaxID=108931 RepID=UPI00193C8F9D|nr:syntaxin-8-like isoform X2 [Nilaparvata lugens]